MTIQESLEFDERHRLKGGGDEGLVSSSGGGCSSSSNSCHVSGIQILVVPSNPHDVDLIEVKFCDFALILSVY